MARPRHLVSKGRDGGKILHYWQPSRSLRALGFRDRRLSDDPAVAAREAEELNREADRYREALAVGEHAKPIPGTMRHLIGAYKASEDFLCLRDSTRRGYLQQLETIGRALGDARLKAVTPPVVQALKRSLGSTPWQANYALRVLRILFYFGIREGYHEGANPALKFKGFRTPARQEVWSHEQERAFLEAAERLRPSLVTAYLLGIYTAQREGDILTLPWSAYDGEHIRIRQAKTGAFLEIPAAERLRLVLDASPHETETLLADEKGRPWQPDHFRHTWARVAAAAGVTGVRFQDLRRTSIVRLAEAGCTIPEITAISGHDVTYAAKIIETYMPRTKAMAASAMAKLALHRPVGNAGLNSRKRPASA